MEIPNTIGILGQSQDKINRQFYKMLQDAEAGDASAIKALADKIGDETTANTILKRLKDLEDGIGADTTSGTVKYRVKTLETTIGDEDTPGTILARIKALEPSG